MKFPDAEAKATEIRAGISIGNEGVPASISYVLAVD